VQLQNIQLQHTQPILHCVCEEILFQTTIINFLFFNSTDGRGGGMGGKGKEDMKRVHQPVYPVCVEHYFSRFEPFDSLVFTDAHVHTHYDAETGLIRARSMSIRSPLFQGANEIHFTETHADWQASYQERGERAKDPLPEISHWGMANGWKTFVQLPLQ
jgi:hypothetical protein